MVPSPPGRVRPSTPPPPPLMLTAARARTRRQFPDGAFPIDSTGVNYLVQLGVPKDELESLGNNAVLRGYSDREPTQTQLVPETPSILGYPPLSPDWREIDGTVPFSKSDQDTRFIRGPSWDKNSCAVDCVLVAALMLDIGRRQVDQLGPAAMRKLGPLPRALFMIIRKPWSELRVADITILRDTLRDMLSIHQPDSFPRRNFCSVLSVAEALFAGVPQLHATWTGLYSCCRDTTQRFYYHKRTGEVDTSVCLGLPTLRLLDPQTPSTLPETLSSVVERGLAEQSLTFHQRARLKYCPAGPHLHSPSKVPVLVDRLPPVLMISELNLDLAKTNPIGLFSEVKVQHLNTSHNLSEPARYKIVGYIAPR